MIYLDIAKEAAIKSGMILEEGFYSKQEVLGKGRHDLVSQVDKDSENVIIELISQNFSGHSIHAEESGVQEKNSEYKWYIDPLDGTSNLLLGIPYFSVSIALARNGQVILGVVYNPILKELYTAELGKGAFLNGNEIRVSQQFDIKNALIASAYSSNEEDIKKGLKTVEQLALAARKVVINFSPALDLCNIARGKLDGLVDNGTTPEDHAAGSIILTEAGGIINNYKKDTWDVSEVGIIASNNVLSENLQMLAL